MFNDDPITNYIISLQEIGLQMNEIKRDTEYVPIEWYIQLLNNSIEIAEMYRDESERNEKFSMDIHKATKEIAENLRIKRKEDTN